MSNENGIAAVFDMSKIVEIIRSPENTTEVTIYMDNGVTVEWRSSTEANTTQILKLFESYLDGRLSARVNES